jgi:hypothetical protein
MPRIRRYFPVTHDINSDPEVWELRDRLGDRAGFVWLEWLAIADRNEGRVGPNSDSTLIATSSKCRTTKAKVSSVRDYAQVKGWVNLGTDILIAKFWEYHRKREPIKNPLGNSTASLLPSHPTKIKDPAPSADPFKKTKEKSVAELEKVLGEIGRASKDKLKIVSSWIEASKRKKLSLAVLISSVSKAAPYLLKVEDEKIWGYLDAVAKQEFGRFNEGESSRLNGDRAPLADVMDKIQAATGGQR